MSDSGLVSLIKTLANGQQIPISPANAGTTEVFVETTDLDLGSSKEKYVDFLLFEVEGEEFISGMFVDLTTKDRLKDEGVTQTLSIAASDTPIPLDPPVTSRFLKLRLSDLQPVGRWKISAIEFWGQLMEGRFADG